MNRRNDDSSHAGAGRRQERQGRPWSNEDGRRSGSGEDNRAYGSRSDARDDDEGRSLARNYGAEYGESSRQGYGERSGYFGEYDAERELSTGGRGRREGNRYGGGYEGGRSYRSDPDGRGEYDAGTYGSRQGAGGYGQDPYGAVGDAQSGDGPGEYARGNSYRTGSYGEPDDGPYGGGNYRGRNAGRREFGQGYGGVRYAPGDARGRDEMGQGRFGVRARDTGGPQGQRGYGARSGYGDSDDQGRTSYGSRGEAYDGETRGETSRYAEPRYSGGRFAGVGPKGYTRSDERIKEDINERLTEDAGIDASAIDIQVVNGKVTISGQVDERSMKHDIEDLVERCSGVKDIDNRVTVAARSSRGSGDGGGYQASGNSDEDPDSGRRTGTQSGATSGAGTSTSHASGAGGSGGEGAKKKP